MKRFLDQSLKGEQELRRCGSVERERTVRLAGQLPDLLGLGWISRTLNLTFFYRDGEHRRSCRFEGEQMSLVQKC